MNNNYSSEEQQSSNPNSQNQNVIKGSQRSDGTFRKDIKIREGFINLFDTEKYKIPQRRPDNVKSQEDDTFQKPAQGQQMRNEGGQQKSWNNQYNNNNNNMHYKQQYQNRKDINQGGQITRSQNNMKAQEKTYKTNEDDFPDLNGNTGQNKNNKYMTRNINNNDNHTQNQNNDQFKKEQTVTHVNKQFNQNDNFDESNKNTTLQSDKQWRNEGEDNKGQVQQQVKQENKVIQTNNFSKMINISNVNKDKEYKKLNKKLKEIEQLEQKQQKGMELQPEAAEKVSKKDEIIKMLENLTIDE